MADPDDNTISFPATRRAVIAGALAAPAREAAGRRQQRLEAMLLDIVGMPHAIVQLPDRAELIEIRTAGDFDRLVDADPELEGQRRQVTADLAEHQRPWDEADRQLGYSTACDAEDTAIQREEALFIALFATPATSLAGVAAKIEALVAVCEPGPGCEDEPWLQIRMIASDISRLQLTAEVLTWRTGNAVP